MSKYDPLRHYLNQLSLRRWRATFDEIESILGFRLPDSAYKYQAWWANETEPKTHVQKSAWLKTGWRTEELDLTSRRVTFVRQ